MQLELLIRAAQADWKDVEPSIFGTLLERALDKNERHRLGAHYTPREYVERLVIPTVIQPLRDDWKSVQATAVKLSRDGNGNAALETAVTSGVSCAICVHSTLPAAAGTSFTSHWNT